MSIPQPVKQYDTERLEALLAFYNEGSRIRKDQIAAEHFAAIIAQLLLAEQIIDTFLKTWEIDVRTEAAQLINLYEYGVKDYRAAALVRKRNEIDKQINEMLSQPE